MSKVLDAIKAREAAKNKPKRTVKAKAKAKAK